jgi:transcription antitermination factor NusG
MFDCRGRARTGKEMLRETPGEARAAAIVSSHGICSCTPPLSVSPLAEAGQQRWYAVFTLPQNEKSAARQLQLREIEAFLPTYESLRVWKNRQRVRLELPLFPSYLFVRICRSQRSRVLAAPGVLRIVGNHRDPIPVPEATIDFLRSGLFAKSIEPYSELVVGERVRIRSGPLQGLEGVLVRKNNNLRFVLTIDLINRHASVEIGAENLEPVAA